MRKKLKQKTKELLGEKLYKKLRSYQQKASLAIKFGFFPTLTEIGKFHQTDKFNENHSFSGLSYLDIYEKYFD